MKYSIFGFNQEQVLKFRTTIDVNGKEKENYIDVTDLLILQCVADFMNRQCVYKYMINDKIYFSIQYKALLEDLPILNIGKQALRDRIDKLVLFNLLEKEVIRNEQGSFAVFRIGTSYEQLVYNKKEEGGVYQTTHGCMENYTPKNSSTINSSTVKEKEDKSSKKNFDFKKALISIGVEENIAKDWIAVRKTKKATNTETAFNRIKNEISKSGLSSNECITIAVENSWQGFKSEWIKKNKLQGKQDFFKSYSPQKISDRANDYLHALKVDVDFEMNGIKYLKDGTYINDGKRYYKTKFGLLKEIPIGLVARPSEDWEYDNNSMVWVQDERTETIEDMLF